MSTNYVQSLTLYQAGSGNIAGATSITLTSLQDCYGNVLTMSDFGDKGYCTAEPQTNNEDPFTFTGVVPNSNGTFTLTGVNSILAKTPYTEQVGMTRQHAGGTSVVITDNVAFWDTFPNKNNTEIILGDFQVPAPATDNSVVPKTYVDSVAINGAPDANITVKGINQLTAAPSKSVGQVTISIASPAVITRTAHGMVANNSVKFTTSGTLPTGIVSGTVYYVISSGLTANTFEISATQGGAAINTSGSQSGFHNLTDVTPRALGESDTRLGTSSSNNILLNVDNASTGVDQTQTTQDSSTSFGTADSTTNHLKIAQSFIPGKTAIQGAILNKQADTGSFTGSVTVAVQADSSGSPSGTNLGSVTIGNATWLAIPVGIFEAIFSGHPSLVQGTTYWLVLQTSTADNSNHPNIGISSSGGYSSGSVKYNNTTDGWVSIATIDLYFETVVPLESKIAQYDSSGLIPGSYSVDSSSTDDYFIVARGVLAYRAGQTFTVKITTANTGPATLNVNDLGVRSIVKGLNTPLVTGDLSAGQLLFVKYDGTNMIMQNPTVNSLSAGTFGTWASPITPGTPYQAPTDGFAIVTVALTSGAGNFQTKTDSSATPTTIRGGIVAVTATSTYSSCTPVKKGDYVNIVTTGAPVTSSFVVYFLPIGT